MKNLFCLAAIAAAAVLCAGEANYTCTMKVGNPKFESTSSEDNGKDKHGNPRASNTQTKTMRRKMTCPVTVSVRGKETPSDIRLKYIFLGQTDGKPNVLKNETKDVKLDTRGDFKVDLTSPEAILTETKKITRRSLVSETKGSRVSGCIIQLFVGDRLVRSYASKPSWKKTAQSSALTDEELLKLR